MSEQLDNILQQMQELTATVKDAHLSGDKSTIEWDKVAAELSGMIDKQVAAKIEEAERKRPVRKGEWIGPDGFKAQSGGLVETGKFAGYKMSDVLFAGQFLRRAGELDPKAVKPLSPDMEKLLTATGSGTGDEYVPTGMASELWEDMFLASRVVGTLGVVPMPTDPFDWPVGWGSITFRKLTAGEATDAQDPATAKSTLTSTELGAEVNWNYNLDEDAVIAVMPTLRADIARQGAEAIDAFALNADSTATSTGNINLDDSTPPTDSYYLTAGQDGIRHYYLVDQTGQSADITSTLEDAEWRAGVAKMGKYAADPARVVAFTNVKTYLISLMGLTNVRTVDKYGPQATILTGELARMDGIPIVVSSSMALAEDDGKVSVTAGNNDEGQIALVNRDMWKVGFRRNLMIEIDRDIRKRVFIMVVSFREAIGCQDNGDSSARGKLHTAGIHGITYA